MKRYLTAILILTVLMPLGASAQWYLFPGSRQAKDSTQVQEAAGATDFIPLRSDEEIQEEMESIRVSKVSLILPLRSRNTPNSNFLDFYSGVLMAVDELASDQRRFELTVYDSEDGLPTASQLADAEMIIGPVGFDDVLRVLPRTRGNYIISPLDPKVASLSVRHNVIQAPASGDFQMDEIAAWVCDDLREQDAVVLLQNPDEQASEAVSKLAMTLGEKGIQYSVNSSPSVYEGTVAGTCRFILGSEDEAFCSNAVREIALMNLRGGNNVVYSTSRLRSISDLEVESMHAAKAHITATYYADPSDEKVKAFDDRYMELFKGDPGQWVYQGYDLMMYFGTVLGRERSEWTAELAATPGTGLQTDFRFDGTGKTNTAVRRLRYNQDNTITLLR